MSAAASMRAGAQMVLQRVRGRAVAGVAAFSIFASVLIAVAERIESNAGAGDRTLAGVFRVVVPLASFALVTMALGNKNLKDTVWPAARFGLHRGFIAAGEILASAAVAAVAALGAALAGLLAARAGGSPSPTEMSFAADLATTGWIAPLVAIGYAAWFGLGSTFGKNGGGRTVVLVADFVVGSAGVMGVVLPRGSAYNLIGLSTPLDVPQRAVSAVLVAVTCACVALGAARCRR